MSHCLIHREARAAAPGRRKQGPTRARGWSVVSTTGGLS